MTCWLDCHEGMRNRNIADRHGVSEEEQFSRIAAAAPSQKPQAGPIRTSPAASRAADKNEILQIGAGGKFVPPGKRPLGPRRGQPVVGLCRQRRMWKIRCRIGWPREIAACARSRQLPGRGDIPHQAGAEPPGVRFRPPPESAREAALTSVSRAIGRGNGAEGHENRRFGGGQARNRDRIGGPEPGTGNNGRLAKPDGP